MRKWLKRTLIVLGVLVVTVFLVINFYLGTVVVKTVETAGPLLLGVPVTLEDASFRLLRGHVTIRGFVVGNPEGFKTDKAISVDQVTIDLVPKSLFSDTLVIKRIYVNAPDITYELGLGKSNLGRILEQAEGPGDKEADKGEEKKEEPAKEEKDGKKVVIEDVLIENGRVRLSTTLALGAAAPIPLPEIHLKDIGKDKQGESAAGALRHIFGAIVGSVTRIGGSSSETKENDARPEGATNQPPAERAAD